MDWLLVVHERSRGGGGGGEPSGGGGGARGARDAAADARVLGPRDRGHRAPDPVARGCGRRPGRRPRPRPGARDPARAVRAGRDQQGRVRGEAARPRLMWCHVLLFGFPVAGLLLFAMLPFPVALAVYLPLSALSVGVGWVTVRALCASPTTGAEALPGRVGRVAAVEAQAALVSVDGGLWEAGARDGPAPGARRGGG